MKNFIAFFVIAVLSGLGVGSGGLPVIYLTLVEKLPQLTAQGTNLIFFIITAGTSLLLNLKKRNIPFAAVLAASALGVVGSLAGSSLISVLPAAVLGKIFGGMLVLSGIYTLRKK